MPADTFPVRLRLARIHAGDITVEEAAVRCGVKRATWSTWERGVHKPPHFDAMVKAIASGLDVDEEWLRDGGPLAPDPGSKPRGGDLVTLSDAPGRNGRGTSAKRRNSVYCSATTGYVAA